MESCIPRTTLTEENTVLVKTALEALVKKSNAENMLVTLPDQLQHENAETLATTLSSLSVGRLTGTKGVCNADSLKKHLDAIYAITYYCRQIMGFQRDNTRNLFEAIRL